MCWIVGCLPACSSSSQCAPSNTGVEIQTAGPLARLNADGSLDNSFQGVAGSYPSCIAVQADGKILLGGWFSSLNSQTRNYIGRLNSDGTLDAFSPVTDSAVLCLSVQSDTRILAAGRGRVPRRGANPSRGAQGRRS